MNAKCTQCSCELTHESHLYVTCPKGIAGGNHTINIMELSKLIYDRSTPARKTRRVRRISPINWNHVFKSAFLTMRFLNLDKSEREKIYLWTVLECVLECARTSKTYE